MKSVKVGSEIYETVPDEARIAVAYLFRLRDRFGITPESRLEGSKKDYKHTNRVIRRFALEVYRVWATLYPQEYDEFIEQTKHELKYERSVQDSIKAGGYSPTSFPMRLEAMYNILIPNIKIQDKRFWKPMFEAIPELRRSNYA